MAHEDILMGMRDGTRVYASHRIDYDSTDDIRVTDAGGERFDGAIKSPPPGHDDHPVKDGYQRKAIVEDAATRDAVTAFLDAEGVSYTVENVAPTAAQQSAIEGYGAESGAEGMAALAWEDALSNAGSVSDMVDIERGVHPVTGEELPPKPGK